MNSAIEEGRADDAVGEMNLCGEGRVVLLPLFGKGAR